MKSIVRFVGNRLKVQNGFSLTELLAVIVVMTLMGVMMATGIPAAQKAYLSAVDKANAESVLFTAVEQLRTGLSVGDVNTANANPSSSGATEDIIVTYKDVNSGFETSIVQDADGLYFSRENLLPDGGVLGSNTERLIPQSLAKGAEAELVVQFDLGAGGGITPDPSERVFVVKDLEVIRKGDTSPLASLDNVTVKSLV